MFSRIWVALCLPHSTGSTCHFAVQFPKIPHFSPLHYSINQT